MTITIARGTDVGAPSLTGTVGAAITLFDYLLVDLLEWDKVYTGTNKAVYRATTGNRFYFRVDDSIAANYCRVRVYESMSDIDTGSGPVPTDAQISGGGYLNKSQTGTTNQVGTRWDFFSNGTIFYLFLMGSNAANNADYRRPFVFGDFPSFKGGDAYNTILICEHANSYAINASAVRVPANRVNGPNAVSSGLASMSNAIEGHYVVRPYTQVGGSVAVGKRTDTGGNWSDTIGNGSLTYPAPIEGGLLMAPIWITEGLSGLRGLLPGIWSPLHNQPLTHGDTFSGSGDLTGRTFEAITLTNSAQTTYTGQAFIETSDTWDD